MDKQTRDQVVEILTVIKEKMAHWTLITANSLISEDITVFQSLCEVMKKEFSPVRAGYYIDIFKGIISAYQNSEINHVNATNIGDISKLSIDILVFVIKELKEEKEIKKEILFLPYKASMWDSLESIWKAAEADKQHCNAYVVPIPYCGKNPDGTVNKWYYEGNQFPDYVPIIDFQKYDIAVRHPDVIYIHNPYDGANRITSVDSHYYSSELKKYTNMLVYVPYFVVTENIESHFCQTPGVINADKVIVQSEEIKKQYEMYYPGGNPPKDKFLPLGSPKFDKVLSSEKKDFILPSTWKNKINGKKVILYNTSLGAVFENAAKTNAKLRYVFSVFKKRDDVVLWWRPHPLMKDSMKSMHPEILYEYQQIEQNYKDEGWGIYDDTADLHRAIAWSDAYYGDMSSVVCLYNRTGKGILLQNLPGSLYSPYWFYDVVEDFEHDCFWFLSPVAECLYAIDSTSGSINNEVPLKKDLFSGKGVGSWPNISIKKIKNQILIYPYHGNLFYIYDIETNKIENINTDIRELNLMIMGSIEYNECLFLWNSTPQLWVYNPKNKMICLWNEWINLGSKTKKMMIQDAACIQNDRLYIPLATNQLLEINFYTKKAVLISTGNETTCYVHVTSDGEKLWLLENSAIIDSFQPENKQLEKYYIWTDKVSKLLPYFVYIIYTENKILLFPCCEHEGAKEIMAVSLQDGTITRVNSHDGGYAMVRRTRKNYIFALDICKGQIDIYDDEGYLQKTVVVNMGEERITEWRKDCFGIGEKIATEKYDGLLEDFIRQIEQHNENKQRKYQESGKCIYQWQRQV
ncbi:hypothetical protein [Pectinatus haikarae]|uniref:hypothetical protein n=1 Tax=Pectinatus haikarae TaxID=349096 RepID=UPI0018C4CC9B|nr:hypothetical protein [Pectinatus haikarae]